MRRLVTIVSLVLFGLVLGCGNEVEKDLAENQVHVKEVAAGGGEPAAKGDHVRVEVEGRAWVDGAKGDPVDVLGEGIVSLELVTGEVMPGLLEAIVGMREGGRREVVIGPDKVTARFRPVGLPRGAALWCDLTLDRVLRVQTEDLGSGDGEVVEDGDYVAIDYTGWHADIAGEKADLFISSEESGEPARLLVGAGMVNEGLDIGLVGMRVGGQRRIVVPPELGYGERGQGDVRPGATLIYEVNLREILTVETETLREGSGAPVVPGQRVTFHLAGWLRNDDGSKGEAFQDSRDLASPYVTFLGRFKVQPGIELGMRGMRPGELRRIDVPAALAFGDRGYHRGPRTLVPPDTDVIYEVEVLANEDR